MRHCSAPAAVAISLAVSVCTASCGGGSPTVPTYKPTPSPPIRDYIGIADSIPAAGTTLKLGQTVTFSETAYCTLGSADSAAVTLVIRDQADRGLQPAGSNPTASIGRGDTQIPLSQTIILPGTGVTSVQVSNVLTPAGPGGSPITMTISYPVE